MSDEDIQCQLPELTGRHICANCLTEIGREEYFANDFLCARCAETVERYPLATTPNAPEPVKDTPDDASSEAGSGSQR